jgi:leucyl aminopeptidase
MRFAKGFWLEVVTMRPAYDRSLEISRQGTELVNLELIPAERDVQIVSTRGGLSARTLETYDAAIIVCDRERAPAVLDELPFAPIWRRLYEHALTRGPVAQLTARVGPAATPVAVVLVKSAPTKFEQLTLAARTWKEVGALTHRTVLLAVRDLESGDADPLYEAFVAALLAATASMPTLKSKPAPPAALARITLLRPGRALDLSRSVAIDRGNHVARWLTLLPPNVLDCVSYRRALEKFARTQKWTAKFYDERALGKLGAGAFLAVARANEHRGAGILHLRYRASAGTRSTARLALVGKGICFDTGGINLKTHKGMYHMHEDMQGSAVAVGTLLALSALDVPYDIDCWLALTENEIGPRAYRPQEVVRAANGVTIQVAHSDAEGRMALADTLVLASREEPDLIIDFATLTGACVTALTERFSGAFTNRAEWRTALELAGRHSGERVWPFPMDEDFDHDLESSVADILQCTPDSKGDHIFAARFLNRFVPHDIPWIHLDLAASNRSGGLAHIPTDFTGFGVRYATHLLLDHDVFPGRARAKHRAAATRVRKRVP